TACRQGEALMCRGGFRGCGCCESPAHGVSPSPLSILQNLESKRFINLDLENKQLISEILILLELCLTVLESGARGHNPEAGGFGAGSSLIVRGVSSDL